MPLWVCRCNLSGQARSPQLTGVEEKIKRGGGSEEGREDLYSESVEDVNGNVK